MPDSMDFVCAATQKPPKEVKDRDSTYCTGKERLLVESAESPVVISISPRTGYRTQGVAGRAFFKKTWKIENRIIYPPSLVMDRKPFRIEASRASPKDREPDAFFALFSDRFIGEEGIQSVCKSRFWEEGRKKREVRKEDR